MQEISDRWRVKLLRAIIKPRVDEEWTRRIVQYLLSDGITYASVVAYLKHQKMWHVYFTENTSVYRQYALNADAINQGIVAMLEGLLFEMAVEDSLFANPIFADMNGVRVVK